MRNGVFSIFFGGGGFVWKVRIEVHCPDKHLPTLATPLHARHTTRRLPLEVLCAQAEGANRRHHVHDPA